MKLLYDQQALELIRNNRGIPLSAMGMEIYGSYLSCQYVSASTKTTILWDIRRRVYLEHEALEVHSNMIHDLLQALPVTVDTWISHNIRRILVTLANHEATAAATCGSLVALVCDSDIPEVADGAFRLLSEVPHIKLPPVTTGASVEARPDHFADMLKAPSTPEWRYPVIFQILSHMALHESVAVAIVEANILNSMDKLLRSHSTNLYHHIFQMLESLASHESTATAVLDMHLFDLLVTLWRETDHLSPSLTINGIDLLACLARWRDGAEGVVAAKALDNVFDGLHSFSGGIRKSTCQLLRALLRHESTMQAVVAIVRRQDIVTLLRDWSDQVRECAAGTLRELDTTLERIDSTSRNQ
ncbi:hypothetical protein C8J57DRAFT_1341104 [Mycena rebaudengoi]|nr:hypothetical protein C8J57DRAFT_1341104 [Mycena rebaudengoi]